MASSAVLDASVLVRALVYVDPQAQGWLERVALGEVEITWPTLLYAEVAHALLRLHRAGRISLERARRSLDAVLSAPALARPLEPLVEPALRLALTRGLTVYDACYVVLAETLDAPLVTADRRLAQATPSAVLLTHD
jgi:predicted nucleic acid-binding protein